MSNTISLLLFVSPSDHFKNLYPEAALALILTVEPASYSPAPLTDPDPAGLTDSSNVLFGGLYVTVYPL